MERRLSEFFDAGTARRAGYAGEFPVPGNDPVITGLEYDSRKLKPGNLFFALPGLHTDGRRYIRDAVEKGAACVVLEDGSRGREPAEIPAGIPSIPVGNPRFAMSPLAAAFYGFPSRRLGIIGVTGTEGKSTVVSLIFQLLRLMGKKAGFFSTVQYNTGGETQWNPEHQTTPEATAVQRLLWEMAENGCEYAVAEASSHGLSPVTNRLGDVDFDAAVVTNVTREHLEFHGTWEQYRDDKANLFRALDRERIRTGNPGRNGGAEGGPEPFGVINADDPSADFFAEATTKKTLRFSVRGMEADLSLRSIEPGAFGNWYEVSIAGEGETVDLRDQLPGAFNAGNVLAALLVVSKLSALPVREIAPLVSLLKPVRGRMTPVANNLGFEVLVDYAHTPSSFLTIFPPLRNRANRDGKRIISLFGSAGERDTGKRPEQGKVAAEYSDSIILTDEDPRGEKPGDILEEIAGGFEKKRGFEKWKRGENLFLIPDRPLAIRKALSLARKGDIVLLLGKGHENSIIYSENTISFDEIHEAEKALAEMNPPEN
ncbi:MAG: UDP-N-acetylmuramoyl-L-alanyl-D-glutamate--2,6-diaminopimelate ligase [Treponema sp.]|jgi:UDP-N-acetylmuramoyl-L-alanyl-D-glutamate--2,6-diaminopimelate ligase|nr:UDP-N-acetylmuramoyl-L-alanyl-D-glutamate--2,6-diaminopimelate ligase [Treponema sp.]